MRVAIGVLLIAACGSSNKSIDAAPGAADAKVIVDGAVIDGPPVFDARADAMPADGRPDGKPSSVQVVSCAGASPVTVVGVSGGPGTYAYSFTASSTVAVNDVVRFTMPSAIHSAISGTPPNMSDGNFAVPLGGDVCLKFTAMGSFPFYCSFHFFTGTIKVQ